MVSRAQCPDNDAVRRQVLLLRNTVTDTTEQIRQLLRYDSLVSRCPCGSDSTREFLLRRIGTLYRYQSDYTRAIVYYTKASQLITDHFDNLSINRRQIVTNYYFLSELYGLLHNLPEKRKAEDRCIDMALQLHISADIACIRCLYARVEYLFDIGDYHRCVSDAQTCERLAKEYEATPGSSTAVGEDIAASSRGWCIESLLRLQDFEQVEQLLTGNIAQYKKSGLANYLGLIYVELAEVQLHKRNDRKALAFFNLALQSEQARGKEFYYKQTLKTIGDELYFSYFNDPVKALQYYRAALQHNRPPALRTRVDSIEDASILDNIANVYVLQNRFDSAFIYFQLAFNQVKPGSDETGILQSSEENIATYKKIHYLASLLIDKADAYRGQCHATGNKKVLNEALRIYRVADQLLGQIDAIQSDLQSRLFWRKDTRRLYEHAIDVCCLQHNDSAAFYFFEKSRAVLLNDQLLEQRLRGGDAIARRGLLLRKIVQQERDLEGVGNDKVRYTDIKAALFASQQELDSLERSIKLRDPLYYQGFIDNSFTTLQDTRNGLLKDYSGLLEIFYGDSAVYSLLLTADHDSLRRIDKTIYDQAVQEYLSFLADPALLNRRFPEYMQKAHQLCDLLFAGQLPPPGRLIVSPDGRSFPLEALTTNADPHVPGYLLNNYALSYTYSVRYLQNNFVTPETTPAGSFLGVAPVQYNPVLQLAALQGSDRSLQTISGYFSPSLNLLSGAATRDRFRREFSNYRVIQLYTHSCDSSSNKEPVIYFADSALYLSDLIPENKPATRLIVLSACETANGRFYRGEGVFSFNRGFAALGIPTSVSNLWSIDNTATYRITELFYKYLSQHMPIDLALQKAKLEFIRTSGSREKLLPYYWAASIVIGKTDPIDYPRPSAWPWIVAGLLLLLLLAVLWRRRLSIRRLP
jgi:TPR repeat protein